ncbi:MAG: N-acetyltransferase [Gemmatimonadales bacterium]|nr:MAG: N-acetyltransferase [Gemmatimonadales bacterium]
MNMSELTIREMEQGEDFADWFADLTMREEDATGDPTHLEDHSLILSNEVGDWIGGLRYSLRGGVAHLQDIAVREDERHRGHAHRLLEGFEGHARNMGAHLAEFWTDDFDDEPELLVHDWQRVLRRDNYIGMRTWYLMEKPLL